MRGGNTGIAVGWVEGLILGRNVSGETVAKQSHCPGRSGCSDFFIRHGSKIVGCHFISEWRKSLMNGWCGGWGGTCEELLLGGKRSDLKIHAKKDAHTSGN